jgi:uncharacterized protein with LGFP repeats
VTDGTRGRRWRALTATIAAVAVVLSPIIGTAPASQAADLSQFRPGEIVSDEVFFNENTMDAAAVQRFLDSKVSACASGYTCLKDYRQDTRTIPGTPMCDTYHGASRESAADIIVKVARACGVNPQVILVMLQKEQGLVTATRPSSGAYRSAMGAGCPDTAPCDADYYGFFDQVHYGVYLLVRYTQPAGTGAGTEYGTRYDLRYPVGQYSNVQYHPNTSCGTKSVYIANQATHALYIYTPYTPNQAALNAGYGTGDGCSAYGNRNFFSYLTDWFGTKPTVGPAFTAYYNSSGGPNGPYGQPSTPQYTLPIGKVQTFTGGVMYSTSRGVVGVRGWIEDAYAAAGSENSVLGLPTADEVGAQGGAYQQFANGRIYASGAGAFIVRGWIGDEYLRLGADRSALGMPLGNEYAVVGGFAQKFVNGMLITDARGVYAVRGWIGNQYKAIGAEKSVVGKPTGNERTENGLVLQDFANGSIVCCSAGGAWVVRGSIGEKWFDAGAKTSKVGMPTANEQSVSGGASQQFVDGQILASSAGSFIVRGWIGDTYRGLGAWNSRYGLPTGDETTDARGRATQSFADGTIYATPRGAFGVRGWVGDKYAEIGELDSVVGAPTGPERSLTAGGAVQAFVDGSIFSSPRGAFVVRGSIGAKYAAIGKEASVLGYPVSDERRVTARNGEVGYVQSFSNGHIHVSSAGSFVVRGSLGAHYDSLGGAETSGLGFARSDEASGNGVWSQEFQFGRIELRSSGYTVVRY